MKHIILISSILLISYAVSASEFKPNFSCYLGRSSQIQVSWKLNTTKTPEIQLRVKSEGNIETKDFITLKKAKIIRHKKTDTYIVVSDLDQKGYALLRIQKVDGRDDRRGYEGLLDVQLDYENIDDSTSILERLDTEGEIIRMPCTRMK